MFVSYLLSLIAGNRRCDFDWLSLDTALQFFSNAGWDRFPCVCVGISKSVNVCCQERLANKSWLAFYSRSAVCPRGLNWRQQSNGGYLSVGTWRHQKNAPRAVLLQELTPDIRLNKSPCLYTNHINTRNTNINIFSDNTNSPKCYLKFATSIIGLNNNNVLPLFFYRASWEFIIFSTTNSNKRMEKKN